MTVVIDVNGNVSAQLNELLENGDLKARYSDCVNEDIGNISTLGANYQVASTLLKSSEETSKFLEWLPAFSEMTIENWVNKIQDRSLTKLEIYYLYLNVLVGQEIVRYCPASKEAFSTYIIFDGNDYLTGGCCDKCRKMSLDSLYRLFKVAMGV